MTFKTQKIKVGIWYKKGISIGLGALSGSINGDLIAAKWGRSYIARLELISFLTFWSCQVELIFSCGYSWSGFQSKETTVQQEHSRLCTALCENERRKRWQPFDELRHIKSDDHFYPSKNCSVSLFCIVAIQLDDLSRNPQHHWIMFLKRVINI